MTIQHIPKRPLHGSMAGTTLHMVVLVTIAYTKPPTATAYLHSLTYRNHTTTIMGLTGLHNMATASLNLTCEPGLSVPHASAISCIGSCSCCPQPVTSNMLNHSPFAPHTAFLSTCSMAAVAEAF